MNYRAFRTGLRKQFLRGMKSYRDFQRICSFSKYLKPNRQICGIVGNKAKCGISRTIAGQLTPITFEKEKSSNSCDSHRSVYLE